MKRVLLSIIKKHRAELLPAALLIISLFFLSAVESLAQPTASISGNATVCRNAASPVITFTGAAGAEPYTFTYRINTGSDQIVISSGAIATVLAPTDVAGTFTYTLVSAVDNGSIPCTITGSGIATVIINDLPAVSFTGSLTDQCVTSTTYTLSGGSPGGGSYSGLGVTGTNFDASVAGVGTHTITYTYTDGNGCSNSATNTITVDQTPTGATVGATQNYCATLTSLSLGGNTPTVGTGQWSQVSGPGTTTFSTPTAGTSTATATAYGTYVYRWTISNGTCTPSTADITVNYYQTPTGATAGVTQNYCATLTSLSLGGNTPTVGTGQWSQVSGPGTTTFSAPTSGTSTATATAYGTYVYRWTISNGTCTPSTDDITVNYYQTPTAATVGSTQNHCATLTSTSLGGNTPGVGTGLWSQVSGPGTTTFSTPTAGTSTATATVYGTYVYRWTISNGTCTPSTAEITVNYYQTPTIASVGATQNYCATLTSLTLGGNTPTVGTGQWSQVSGPGTTTFSTPTAGTSTATATAYGTYVYRWTISNGTCTPSTADITVNYYQTPTGATVGATQNYCATLTSLSLGGNTPTVGTGQWSQVSGPGTTTFSAQTSGSSTATATAYGTYVYRWTISNGTCTPSTADITVNYYQTPTGATVGATQNYCATLTSTSLGGNTPAVGTGQWSQVSGPGTTTFSAQTSGSSTATATAYGTYVYRWTISNGTCTPSTADITVNYYQTPTGATVGATQNYCATLTSLSLGGNTPAVGTGQWSQVSGPGTTTFSTPTAGTSTATATVYGTYVYRWTISNGTCTPSTAEITVNYYQTPTIASVGATQNYCATLTSLSLGGNTPTVGTGQWSQVSGPGTTTFSTPTAGTSTATATAYGTYVYRWTISNGTCTPSTADITVNYYQAPTISNAGPDQTGSAMCGLTTATLAGNAPTVGTGVWTIVSGTGGTITTPTSRTSTFTGVAGSTYILEWTISNGTCTPSADQVTITFNQNPTPSNAGLDQTGSALCGLTTTTLEANNPVVGIGLWSIVTGTGGTIAEPSNPTSSFSGTPGATYTLRWTIFNSPCTASTDDVVITFRLNPVANAGPAMAAICQGGTSVNLGGSVSGSATGGIWSDGGIGGVFAPGATTLNSTWTPPAAYSGTAVLTLTTTGGICGTDTDSKNLVVNPLPTASISGTTAVCRNAPDPFITFTGANGTAPYTFTYRINTGSNLTVTTLSGNSVSVAAPTTTAGTFTYTLISVRDGSTTLCSQTQSGTATVTVNPLPSATISGTTAVCRDAASPLITFTGSGGTAPYTFTYNINGGPEQTVTGSSGNTATVPASTTAAGSFVYNLVSVRDASSTLCTQAASGSATVTVNQLPTATISGTTAVCEDAAAPQITFTGANGTAPYTFTYNINNGSNLTVTTLSGNSVPVSVSTSNPGTFTYNLVSVTDGSSTACSQNSSGSATVTVNPLPSATISGTTAVCAGSAAPLVTFAGSNGTAPYTFAYNINGGATRIITTSSGNTVTVEAETATSGTFTYNLLSVTDASSTTCSRNLSGSAVITVNPLPTATISGTTAVCVNAASPNITFTGAGGTAPYTFTYTINGGGNLTATTISGNSVNVSVSTATAGTLTYSLVSVRDGTSTQCNQLQTGSAIVTVNPLPTATISGTTAVCLNSPSPLITFTGAGGTAPYTFTFNVNGGTAQTITTLTGNSVTYAVLTTTAGTFNYNLVSVRDNSSTQCLRAQTGTATITVNPLPVPTASNNGPVCAGSTLTLTGGPAGMSGYAWTGPNGFISALQSPTVSTSATAAMAGVYTLTVTNSNGCQNSVTTTVTVNPLPVATAANNSPVCATASLSLTGGPSAMTTYAWTGPNGFTSSLQSPVVNASATTAMSGVYTLTVRNSNGCQSSATTTAVVNPLPTATISGTTAVCKDAPQPSVTFTGAGGTAPYTFSYRINGGAIQTVPTTVGNSIAVLVPTGNAGTFTYTLVSVQDASSTACLQAQTGSATVTVNPLPTATITGTTSVCRDGGSPLITFTGANGTAPYTFTYTVNSGSNQTISTLSGNSVTIPVNTSTAGTFTYSLVAVRDASSTTCQQSQGGSATVTVLPLPTATISGTTAVCVNAPSPQVTFTGGVGTAPFTFTYTVNGGGNQTISTSAGNSSVSILIPTSSATTFTYSLVSVSDGSSTPCSQAQTGSAVVTINPLPTATVSGTTAVCQNAPAPDITFTGSNGTAPYTFTYTINSGSNQTISTTTGNSITIPVATSTTGVFTYSLVSVRDASTTACTRVVSSTATVTVNPLPTATISGTTTVCRNATSPAVTFTGAGGTAPYTFTYRINGGSDLIATTSTGNSVNVLANTSTAGTFTYSLVSVRDASSSTCSQPQSGTAVITVNQLPSASISGTTTVCRDAVAPLITFTGSNGTAPYTFTYRINSGTNQTITTSAGNSVTLEASTAAAGTFTYYLVSVQDASSTLCSQTQTGSAVITVNELPATSAITGTQTPACSATGITYSVTNTAGSTYAWSVPTGASIVSGQGTNSITVNFGTTNGNVTVVETNANHCTGSLRSRSVTLQGCDLIANFSANNTAICIGSSVIFTNISTGTTGTTTYSWNFGSGATPGTATGIGPHTVTYTTTGAKNVTLTITDGASDTETKNGFISVNPLPTASIAGNATVCEDAASPLITFTGATGTAPYTFTYTVNGGAPQTATTTSGSSVTVPVLTATPGTYTYALVSVQDASASACSQPQTGSATVTVNPLPTATISGTTAVCRNAAQPVVTFTGANGTSPYTFTYTLNGGASQTITSTGNTATLNVLTSTPGTFTYALVSVRDASSTLCSQPQTGSAVVTVNPLPSASISGTAAVCQSAPSPYITFTGSNGTAPYTFTFTVNGGTNQTVTTTVGNSISIPVNTSTPGSFVYSLVSVQDASSTTCLQAQTGSATITVNPLPSATVSGTTSVCVGAAAPNITFTGSGGSAPYTFTYTINGGGNQTITSSGNSVPIPVNTGAAGTFTYALVSVRDASSTTCQQNQTGSATVTVNPLPTATISGTTAVCQSAPQPVITFTGAGGTAPYTFTYNVNSGTNQTVTTISGNSVTVPVNTANAGTFTYILVSVRDGSSTLCQQTQAGSATITVNPLPAATISGTTTVCQNAPAPNVTFTGLGGTAPYTFTFNVNGGSNQTVTTGAGSSVLLPVTTGTAGTFTYNLVSVRDASSTTCLQAQTGSAVITVNPLPTATVSGTTAVCQNAAQPVITFTGANGTAPYTFTYNVNSGSNQTVTTLSGNSVTVPVNTGTTGTFTYILVSVRDGSSTACQQTQAGSATITVNPLPTATISGTTTVCQNAASPNITFTGLGGTAPYTFTFRINSGTSQTVTTSVGNSITVPAMTDVVGTFTYTLLGVQDASSTACTQSQAGSAVVTVNPLPTATISGTTSVCQNGASPGITFTGSGGTAPYTFTYNINGGTNLTATTSSGNSTVVLANTLVTGTFTYNLVSVRDGSSTACLRNQTGTAVVTVNPLPTATIGGTTTVCRNAPSPSITFTGSGGTAPYTFTYTINGGSNLTATTSTGNSTTVNVNTATPGTFTYALVSVRDASSSLCNQPQTGSAVVTVNPLPTATISGTTAVCRDAASPYVTFTGSNGTAPYTFTYTVNGGSNQTVTTTTGNSVQVEVQTGTAGTFTYALVSVRDGGSVPCSNAQTGSAVVTVNQLPTATISGTTTVCRNAPSPNITFTGSGGTAPYTFTYTINGGSNLTATTITGSSVNVTVNTATPGTFTYTLVSVSDGSSTTCSNSATGSAVVTVNPLPSATISGTTAVCQNGASPNITFTGSGGTAPYTFTFTVNGGSNQTATTATGNSVTVPVNTTTAGTFTYALVSVRDGSSTTCSNAATGSAVVTVNQLPTATISGTAAVCQNGTSPVITFTGASGTAPYTFTYNVNGGTNQTVTTITGSSVTVQVETSAAGSFTYNLVSVRDGSTTTCQQAQTGSATVTVNPLPTATISGTAAVCQNGTAPGVLFTGAGGTAPYTFTYRINSGSNQTVTTSVGNSITVLANTATAGTFTYTLLSVRDASSTTCTQAQTGTAVITVNPLPSATISGTTAVCQNAASPLITFTGAGGTAPYTFTYTLNGGTNQTITTQSGNSVTLQAPTTTVGTSTYALVSVRDASSTTCTRNQTGTAVITVNPLPVTSAITGIQTPACSATGQTYSVTLTTGSTYLWSVPAGATIVSGATGPNNNSITVNFGTNNGNIGVTEQFATGCLGTPRTLAISLQGCALNANFAASSTTICSGSGVTFTDLSTGVSGLTTYSWNFGTGATPATATGAGPHNVVYTGAGQKTVSLTITEGASDLETKTNYITVNPLPTASISGTTAVCQSAAMPLVTFTGGNGTAPYTFTYTVNGGANQTAVSSGNVATVPASTATSGSFVYSLVSVQDASTTVCIQPVTGSATITVNPLPTATVSGTTAVCVGAAAPNITFTGSGGTAPYTFTYTLNGGGNQTITSSGNSVTIPVNTGAVGTFSYALVSVRDASSTTCQQNQTGSATVTVNPLPTATISGTTAVCQSAPQPVITFTGAGGTAPYTFTYNINSGTNQTVTTISGSSVTVPVNTANAGTFTYILVSVRDGSSTACLQTQAGSATVTVNPLPSAAISGTTTVCRDAATPYVTFTGSGGTSPYSFTFNVNGGSSQTVTTGAGSTVSVPVATGTPGTFTYNLISVRDASSTTCLQAQTGSAVITVNPLPTATVSGTTAVCQNAAQPLITFTGANGTAPYTFTYNVNSGSNQTVTTLSGNSVTVPVNTGTTGTFTYILVSVRDGSSTACQQTQAGSATITVNPLPTATISGTTAVCLNAPQPNITFTGSGGTAPYTFTYRINGGTIQTVPTTVGNSITVPVNTTTVGTFTYTLLGVQDASSTACTQAQTGSAVVTVNPLPTATISGTTAVCQNAAAPNITFTGSGGTAPYTFTYNINGGTNLTATTLSGNSVTVAANTSTTGTFTYNLVSVRDGSSTACLQNQTGTAVITVNPLPSATIGGTTTVCRNAPSPSITFTGSGGTAPYTFTYTINGGTNLTATTSTGNSTTVNVNTATPGTYTYALVSVRDASSSLCNQPQTGSAVVTVNPLPSATISGTTAVCRDAASPYVTFTGSGGTAPYTFTFTVNGGSNQTVTTTAGNSVPVEVPTGTAGTFTYALVSVRDASVTTCQQSVTGSAVVTVNPLPSAAISGTASVCRNAASPNITFTGSGGTAPYTFTYTINGGSNLTATTITGSSVNVAVNTTTPGTFTYALVSVRDGSSTTCNNTATGSAVVTVNPLPSATISGTTAVCQNAASPYITFTGSNGTAPYIFTFTVNGGSNQTATTVTGNSVTVPVNTTTAGTFTYALVSVRDGSSTTCSNTATGSAVVTVNPLPTATISGTAAVCQNGASPVITFTGSSGTAPYTFTYNVNGGTNQTATTISGNSVTIPVETSAAGSFTYNLVSVRDGSTTTCQQAQTGSATVTVNPLPTATISGTTAVCQNGTAPGVLFTGSGGTAPYTFTYRINSGSSQTVTTLVGNSITVFANTATAGTFTYTLLSVRDASSTTCTQAQTGTAVITVNPLPSATIGGTMTVCQNAPSPLVTFTGSDGTAPYTFTYTLNGGTNQTITTLSGNSVTLAAPTATVGTSTYALVSVRDASTTACTRNQTGTAVITVNPLPVTSAITGNQTPACSATGETYSVTLTTGSTYLWTVPAGATIVSGATGPNNNSITVNFGTNNGNISVTEQFATGCLGTPRTLAISLQGCALNANFAASSTTICSGSGVTFTDLSTGVSGLTTYSWNFGTGATPATATGAGPHNVVYTGAGQKTVSLTITEGASDTETRANYITVNPLPTATVGGTIAVCRNAAMPLVTFTGADGTAPYTFTYTINGGVNQTVVSTGNVATVPASTATPGSYVYSLVSVRDASSTACVQPVTGSATITVNPLPSATISGTTAVCRNASQPTITFTGNGGTAPYTFTYTVNGGSNLTVTSSGNTATLLANTTNVGTFTYALVSVHDASSTACSQAVTGSAVVTVNPLPTATISGTTAVCRYAASPNITFTGAGGTAPYTFTYNINSGTNLTVTTVVGNSATVPVATNNAGSFTYALVSVSDASSTSCSQIQGGTATVIVNQLPTATVTGSITVCRNAPAPSITFTGNNGIAPYSFTYSLNGGINQTITTVSGNSVSITVLTGTPGTYTYSLVSVRDGSSTSCSQPQTGSATVTVNPLPSATITGTTVVCKDGPQPLITLTGSNGVAPYTFIYSVNSGNSQIISTVAGNTVTIPVNTSAAGTFTYSLFSVTDGSPDACTQLQSGTATVTVNQLPTATITGTTAVCQGASSPNITFTGAGGTAPYTFVYRINSGGNQTITTTSGNSINLPVPTGTAGTFTYSLVSVTEGSGIACSQTQTGDAVVTVNPLPTATISGTTTVCRNATRPVITFTGSNGTAPYTFSYRVNGGTIQTATSTAGSSASVLVETSTAGTFTYSLVSVRDGSSTACLQNQTGTAVVTVNPLPTATISGTTTVCMLSSSPNVTFNGAGGTAPYTFTYRINSGSNLTVTTVSGSSVTVPVPTDNSGVFAYSLVSVRDGSVTTCSQSQSGTATITIDALPVPNPGPDGNECDLNHTFAAVPSIGTGTWTRVSGPGAATFTPNASAPNATVTVTLYGTYVFRWTEVNGTCSAFAEKTVTFWRQPVANPGPGGNECDLNFRFNAVPTVGTGTWTRTSGPGTATFSPNATSPTATVTVSAYGTYTFAWTEVNGTCSNSASITVNFYQQPVANPGTGGNNCGPEFQLSAVPSIGIGTWTRTSGPGTATFSPNVNAPNARVTVSAYGVYTFTWTEVNGTCSNSAPVSVTFIQSPAANAGPGGEECDLDFALNAILGTGVGTWSLVTGPGSALFNPGPDHADATVTVDSYGTYSFAWTEVNAVCQSTDIIQVIFRPLPVVSAGRDTILCEGATVTLNASGTGTFVWAPADLVSDETLEDPVASPVEATDFIVTLTDQYGCSNSDTVFVDVWSIPVPDAGDDLTLEYVFEYQFAGIVLQEHETGTWSVIQSTATPDPVFTNVNDPDAKVTGLGEGANILQWTVSNGVCPADDDLITITVNDLKIPSLITPNGDQANEFLVIRGLNETLKKAEIVIFDRWGRQVYQTTNYQNDWNGLDQNGDPLPEDTYFYVLKAQNGRSLSGYVVIRR